MKLSLVQIARYLPVTLLIMAYCLPVHAETRVERQMLLPESRFATQMIVQTTDEAGPTVVIVGGVHGNEPAGAEAALQVSRWPIRRGKLICLPHANVTALAENQRRTPNSASKLANLNRNFPRAKQEEAARGELATEIWRVVSEAEPDWLLDLHEGFAVHRQNKESVGSTVIGDTTPATSKLARQMLTRVNATLPKEKQFLLIGPPINSSLARAAHEHLGAQSMILETTYNGYKLPVRVRQHRLMVHRFFQRLDMLAAGVTSESGLLPVDSDKTIRVALYNDGGVSGKGVSRLQQQLGDEQQYSVAQVCGADVAAGALADFDLLLCSGGSGSGQSRSLGETGREEVREFVDEGGDYIGICAGSYLACRGFSWGLGILDAKTVSSKWRRGRSPLPVKLSAEARELFDSAEARELFDSAEKQTTLIYHNGPIIEPLDDPEIPDFTSIATFTEEIAENGSPAGVMINSPAIVLGDYGEGQVLCISPHPEQSEACEQWLPRAVRRLAAEP